jgi:uncharacterized membrane protein
VSWNLRYKIASYVRSSLWVIPIFAVVLAQMITEPLRLLDEWLGWKMLNLGADGAKALAGTVVTLSLSFIVFTFGSLLVAIQVASGQYSPRIIATTLLRDNVIRWTVGIFAFTLIFALKVLDRTEEKVLQLVIFLVAQFGLLCGTAFLYFIDYTSRLLRPVSLVKRVGEQGIKVLFAEYPDAFGASPEGVREGVPTVDADRTVLLEGESAIVIAVNVRLLVRAATRAGGVIEFVPHVGEFLGVDEPLFRLHGGAARLRDDELRDCVVMGVERTVEQDPRFAFRILVDIASKALSAAINDPTTAVLAIDQLHRLVRVAGRRDLRSGYFRDRGGQLRLIVHTPKWDDFVSLAFTEIRLFGSGSMQVARRLRAMIVNLLPSLPTERHAALQQQLELLDQSVEKNYALPADRTMARVADLQGMG